MEFLDREAAMEILLTQSVAHLGVIVDGKPYVTPMSYVVDGDRIRFRTMPGRKLAAIKEQPNVCVEVSSYDDSGSWSSAIVSGTAYEVEDDALKRATIAQLFEKYREAMGDPLSSKSGLGSLEGAPHVIEVVIDDLTGATSGSGFSRRTRPGRL